MKEFLKKNLALVLAFVIPVVFIVIVALGSYLPSLFLTTNYNFIYAACFDGSAYTSYQCANYLGSRYSVVGNTLTRHEVSPTQDSDGDSVPDVHENYSARLFLHDTKTNESREITFEEAEGYHLNGLLTSPDGVSVSGHYTNGGDFFFIFGGGSQYGYYLTKGKSKSRLNLINHNERYYYQDNFRFIGWVMPGRNP